MPASKLRILTLNIAHGRGLSAYQGFHRAKGIERNLDRIARLLRRAAPDVVALQEVDEDSHWNKRIHLLDYLQKEADYPHSQMGVHNRREGRLPLAYGNGVLSRFAIEHADHQAFGTASLGEKGFLYTELTLPDGHLPIVNLHLDFKSRLRRIEQIERLIDFLEARHAEKAGETYFSPIICGDFNSRSHKPSDAVRHLFRYLENHCEYKLYPEKGRTFPSLLPTHGLDFIFVPPSYRVRRCKVLRAYVSDHCPVLLDLEIPDDKS
jgi:endonuclease/exonuclease/phosphatase family metal-dependent hydrolase